MMNAAGGDNQGDPDYWEHQLTVDTCQACNGYYGPCFGEPVCATCHAFLYASHLELELLIPEATEDQNELSDDCDSGNDEPSDYFPLERGHSNSNTPQVEGEYPYVPDNGEEPPFRMDTLGERLQMLVTPRTPEEPAPPGLVDSLPPEVLLVIFSFLDDISMVIAGNVCRRWKYLLKSNFHTNKWKSLTERRWPLFSPMVQVTDWFHMFSCLVKSSFCVSCIYQMSESIPRDAERNAIRSKRLMHDLSGLQRDEGVMAKPLDSALYHWQATIKGPVGSPYEGGLFYLYLKVPFSYPFNPPEVRFLTKIFHPNVSRHGDIGIDSIQKSIWVSALTLNKVLLSIQSLLTDPYCEVCMEQDIGDLYLKDRKAFDSVARSWTWKYAMLDYLPPTICPP
eukprot:TRINITY_DN6107_c0_g1_i16.p1 TRINITY_DN6107_c0_g1~~TRINITY_DN6107_c0_g1_i16.p1  ORF type:complete len:394 (-),score=36.60 TRINITY_DN6107_c0_g1_i16:295-1476(-)